MPLDEPAVGAGFAVVDARLRVELAFVDFFVLAGFGALAVEVEPLALAVLRAVVAADAFRVLLPLAARELFLGLAFDVVARALVERRVAFLPMGRASTSGLTSARLLRRRSTRTADAARS